MFTISFLNLRTWIALGHPPNVTTANELFAALYAAFPSGSFRLEYVPNSPD